MIRQAAIQQLAARYGGRAREEAYLEFAQERGYLAKGQFGTKTTDDAGGLIRAMHSHSFAL